MDRNQVIGLVLMGVLFVAWMYFFGPETTELEPREEPSTEQVTEDKPASPSIDEKKETTLDRALSEADTATLDASDSLSIATQQQQYGVFAGAATGEAKEVTAENDLMRVVFNTRGGVASLVELKQFKTYQKEPLILFDELSSKFAYLVEVNNLDIDLTDLYYESDSDNLEVVEGDTASVSFTANLGGNRSISHVYTFVHNSYQIGYQLILQGLEGVIEDDNINFVWQEQIKPLEKDLTEARNRTTITYYQANGDFEKLSESSTDLEEETIEEAIKWIGFKQKFFTSAIIADQSFTSGYAKTSVNVDDSTTLKSGEIALQIGVEENQSPAFTYYFGPNDYQLMKKVTDEFTENINLGWPPISYVNKFLIIPIFQFLEKYIGNYGIIIFILVIIIRIILFPLSYKSHVSMAKTRILKPEIDALKEKHGGDMQKMQGDQMQLYQKAGVNPLSGCIPMLLQMPILFAMFYFFPNSIELRQEAFLWADDLSTYDSFITFGTSVPLLGNHLSLFTVLMTISTILYTWMNNQVTAVSGPMKNIGYIMPLVFLFVLNSFSSALTYYYFLSNIFSFGQQAVIKQFVNDEKLKKIIEENKLKNKGKKKSMFTARLEEAMKSQEEAKKQKGKGKK